MKGSDTSMRSFRVKMCKGNRYKCFNRRKRNIKVVMKGVNVCPASHFLCVTSYSGVICSFSIYSRLRSLVFQKIAHYMYSP